MKKVLKRIIGILVVSMIALLSTSAYGSEQEYEDGGALSYCVATGEVTYIPPSVSEHPDETEGFSPQYDPYAEIHSMV